MKGFRSIAFFSCFLLLFPLVCSTGCMRSSSRNPQELLKNAATITATNGELLFTLELTDYGGNFRFSAPELLEDLTITVAGETVTATYCELETQIDTAFFAGIFPIYQAVQAFRKEEAKRIGNENILSVSLDGTTFLLYYDSGGSTITRLEAQGADGSKGFDVLSCLPPE